MEIKVNRFFSQNETLPSLTREQIQDKYKWNLQDIYLSDELWEKDYQWVESNINRYEEFMGRLAESAETMLTFFKYDDEIGIKVERLYLYAMLNRDSDMRVPVYQAMDIRIKTLYSKVSTASSWVNPELLKIPDDVLIDMLHSLEELKVYDHSIRELLRRKAHTLNKDQEELLALAGEIVQVPYNTYSLLTNADLKFDNVIDDQGKESEMSHAKYYAAMYSQDRKFRENAYKTYYKPYTTYLNTFSALFNGNLKGNIFNAKARKYTSALEAALDRNCIPVSVYQKLVHSANDNLKPLHEWGELKKKILKLDELHPYDVYVSLFSPKEEKTYTYEDAVEIVCKSLEPLGSEYQATLRKAFDNRWIDVYETPAKRSGAYSSGTTFGVHPFVLLNWTGLLNDVFTLAHEMGHNMHSYFTGTNQPYPYANYTIFLAEVASTFNEAFLLEYLISNSQSKEEKLFLLEKYLNNITATFYRQVMFAEFEMSTYERTEKGEALTFDVLSKMYKELYQKYWGPAMVIDKEEETTWARIPHFYYNFYVYQYATGFAASEKLSEKVRTEKQPAVEKYLRFLKSGNSDYSINILKNAGVDMNSPEPVLATTKKMEYLLKEVKSLL